MKTPLAISVFLVSFFTFVSTAKDNASFYRKDGTKKEGELLGIINNVVKVRITMPTGRTVDREFPKETFSAIETYDWVKIDLTQSDYTPAVVTPPATAQAQPIGKDTVSQPLPGDTVVQPDMPPSTEEMKLASLIEAGKYERKSVSYVNSIWLMDGSVKNLPGGDVAYALDKIKDKLTMARFDYNPLPKAVIADFVGKANASGDLSADKLAEIIDNTLAPRIAEIVSAYKELRAQSYANETERNSFFAQKAKGYGFTEYELAKVMNSAFIYLPFISNFKTIEKDNKYTVMMDVGIIWYRVLTKGPIVKTVLTVKNTTKSMGFAKTNSAVPILYDGKVCTPQEFAFKSCVKNAARNLLVATQSMPEFRLSGQVLESAGGNVGFELGKKEGLTIDDKFNIAEFTEQEDGKVTQKNIGWVTVNFVADSNSKEGYKSKAGICAGEPYVGAVLSEFPRIPIDIAFKGCLFPGVSKKDCDKGQLTGYGYGGQIDARYNVGRAIGISQLFLGVGFGMGVSGITDSLYTALQATSATHMNIDGFLMKRFLIGRCALGLEVGGSRQTASVPLTLFNVAMKEEFTGYGFFGGGNFSIYFSPEVQLDLGIRYQYAALTGIFKPAKSSNPKENFGADAVGATISGVGVRLGLTWSPPSLPFDPVDMVRGLAGI